MSVLGCVCECEVLDFMFVIVQSGICVYNLPGLTTNCRLQLVCRLFFLNHDGDLIKIMANSLKQLPIVSGH